ncbi:MAG: diguanylate cyclase [Desulfovermiculus sp.]
MDTFAGETPRVLLLDPDPDHGRYLHTLLSSQDLEVTWLTGHLQGLAACQDGFFALIVAVVEGQDIYGPELCALLRRRQQRGEACPAGLVLLGQDRHRGMLTINDPGMDDYVIEPCLDEEIVWRVRHNLRSLSLQAAGTPEMDGLNKVLTMTDLNPFLERELNRCSRRADSLGVVLIKIQGWALLTMDYGPHGAYLVEDIVIHRIQRLVRTYDTVFRVTQGSLAVLLPHASRTGLQGFMERIQHSLADILHSDAMAREELVFAIQGICVYPDSQARPQSGVIDDFQAYVIHRAQSEGPEPGVECIHLGPEGLQPFSNSEREDAP